MSTGNVMIESLGVAIPSTFRSAHEIVAGCRVPIDFNMEAVTGIAATPTLPPGRFAKDLAEQAVEDCLAKSRYEPADVDLLIGCTLVNCNEPHTIAVEPSISALIKERFGLVRALTFDVTAACAGLFVGLYIARAFLTTGGARRALIFAGEYVTHAATAAQAEIESANDPRMPCLTVGDSGAALMLELGSDPNLGLLDFQLYTLGRYSGYCVAKPTERVPGGIVMKTDTVRLALITSRKGMEHFERFQNKQNWQLTQFDFFIPHQASAATLSGAMREANKRFGAKILTEANVINNLAQRGNTVTTTHFMALHDAIRASRIRNGNKLLFSTVASGATIGSAAYYLDDLPERLLQPGRAAPRTVSHPEGAAGVSAWMERLARPVKIDALGVVAPGELSPGSSIELGKAAARRCLSRSAVPRQAIGLLIFAGVYRSEFIVEPAMAAFLAGELRINDSSGEPRTLAFDLNDSSNGFLSACQVAARAIESGEVSSAMVICAEADVPYAPGNPRVAASASAALLTLIPGGGGFTSFGSYEFPALLESVQSKVILLPEGGAKLCRELPSNAVSVYTRSVSQATQLFLDAQPNLRESIEYVILPHVDPEFRRAVKDTLKLRADCEIISPAGDVDQFTSALPAEIERLCETGHSPRGKQALLVSAGAGVKIACASYEF
jgi:3-oxoacyl-[acyl-carrier-protein] synthase III